MNIRTMAAIPCLSLLLVGCGDVSTIGKPPEFTPVSLSAEHRARTDPATKAANDATLGDTASLWHVGPTSLLGDRRAGQLGDLLTVVIEINDEAEMSNSSARSRAGSESLSVPSLAGIPEYVDGKLPDGASSADLVDLSSSSSDSGDGSVRRNEKLTLRIAATVTDVMPNGQLQIEGSQEVRVNHELRDLQVAGFVRPEDISRQNEVTYDRIASARISYGGRGQVSAVQQPRKGKQLLDMLLPF